MVVLEQHAALFCQRAGGHQVGLGLGLGRLALCAAVAVRVFEQTQAGLDGENAADGLVKGLLADATLVEGFLEIF